ncbi:hypothetical protein [uncultured Planktomarina sp.]|uniref:hypothetical protein n=1 Tax=uncultured Planktomarina sp. TaxID=1538529 RepID=UPI00325FFC9D
MVKASVNAAVAKLKLFRIAFGQFNVDEILNATEISAVQTAWNSPAVFTSILSPSNY